MSDKMKRFLTKPSKKIIVEKTKPEIKNLINEAVKIDATDKEVLYTYISEPHNITYVLKTYADVLPEADRTIVISRRSGNMTMLVMYSGLEEISDFIIEMCDQMGWPFTSGIQTSPEKIVFTIFVKG